VRDYSLAFPDDFDQEAALIETKGYFPGLRVFAGGDEYQPEFYDPVRLAQTVEDDLRHDIVFVADNVVVVTAVTRALIEQAVAHLATSDFRSLRPLPR
jgi:hypothetical protein